MFLRKLGNNLNQKFHAVQKFHAKLLGEKKRVTFALCYIANMDQTPLPFVLDDGRTNDAKSSKEVWLSSGKYGLDKRQSTIQLTVFVNEIPRVRPTVIFRGERKRIKASDKGSWDKRVKVYFKKKVWCDVRRSVN